MPSYRPVNALLRGLDVLMVTSSLDGRATVAEIHRRTGIDKATIVRMLETLTYAGFVVRNEEGRGYQITGKTLTLSAGYDRHRAARTIIAPVLSEFRAAIGWPSDVALFDQDAMLVVETSRDAGPIFLNRRPGYRAPMLATSLGRCYLASCTADDRADIMARAAADPAPWNDLARDPTHAEAIFDRIRQRGYATMDPRYAEQEYNGKIASLGVPVAQNGRVFAALNILYLKSALNSRDAVKALLPPLQKTAARLAAALAERWSE